MTIWQLILAVVAAYLIGSLSGSLLIGPLLGYGDPRDAGSHNAGATNALRTGGRVYGLLVLVFDAVKGVVAVLLVPGVAGLTPPGELFCGGAVVVGHLYPVFFGFRGGKGFATTIGVLAAALPLVLAPGAVVFALTLVVTGYVGLATVLAMWGLTLFCATLAFYGLAAKLFTLAMALVITYTHRGNLERAWRGTENRFDKVMWRLGR